MTLSENSKAVIDRWLKKFPADQKQSAVMIALRTVQEENGGSLTEPMMDAIADYLGMEKIAVYEVATFYSMFELSPVGKHKIGLCASIACQLCGVKTVQAHLEKKLGIKLGETTKDGKFTLKKVECLGACVGAPMMQIGNEYFEHLTPEKVDKILDEL